MNHTATAELPDGGEDMIQTEREVAVAERLKYCPECKAKNILSSVERLQYEEGRYWVFCTRKDKCTFLEEFMGKSPVAKEDLTMYGLPGQLTDHMDIFYEDINKIVRLCMAEYIKMKYLASVTEYELEATSDTVRVLAESHQLTSLTKDFDLEEMKDSVKFLESQSLNHQTEVVEANEDQANVKLDLTTKVEASTDLPGLTNYSQISLDNQTSKLQTTEDEVFDELVKIFSDKPAEPVKSEDDETKFHEEKLPSSCKNENSILTKDLNPFVSLKHLADSLVADLPLSFQEQVKAAFSKIEGYNFPDDFVIETSPEKLPLYKILEERKRQEIIKAEVDETLSKFKAELEAFDLLL